MISTSQVLIGAGIIGAVVILRLFMSSRSHASKVRRAPQFFFGTMGGVRFLQAESTAGVMMTESDGGQKEDPAAVAIFRSGRLWHKPFYDPGMLRRRRLVYATRQNDGAPMRLMGLFDGGEVFGSVSKEDVKPHRNMAARQAMAEAVRKRGAADTLTARLSMIMLISWILGGLSWVIVAIAASLKG